MHQPDPRICSQQIPGQGCVCTQLPNLFFGWTLYCDFSMQPKVLFVHATLNYNNYNRVLCNSTINLNSHIQSHNKAWLQSGISYNIATWTIYHIKTSCDLSITWGHTLGFLVMKGGKPQIWKSDIWFQRQWFNNIGTCSIGTSYHLLIIY